MKDDDKAYKDEESTMQPSSSIPLSSPIPTTPTTQSPTEEMTLAAAAMEPTEQSPGNNASSSDENTPPSPPCWCYPRNCRTGRPAYHGNPEALAWAIDNCCTIVAYVGTGAFLGTALLKLAKDAAGCEIAPPEGETEVPPCDERIYGIKPSSLLSTMGTIVDVISASLMPVIGAIVDTTTYRRLLGRILVTFFCTFLLTSVFVSENTWFAIAIFQIVWGFTVWFQSTITYSYLPDLSTDEDVVREYTRSFAALSYTAMIVYMGAITGARAAMGYLDEDDDSDKDSLEDEVKTAQLAQSVSFAICVIGLSIAWGKLFKKRPAIRQLESGKTVWADGFRQVGRTVRLIYTKHAPLKWFYISVMFCDPAIMALTILGITFLTDHLQFTAQENGTAMLLMMLLAVPGSYIGSWFVKRFNAIVSSMVALVVLIVTTTVVSIVLKGAGQQTEAYVLSAFWGLGTGWKWMCDRMVLLLVLPPGQNAELMGVYVFFRQIIAWLPKLVFTILNEKDISQQVGIATLDFYFVVAFAALARVLHTRKPSAVAGTQEEEQGEYPSDEENDEEGGVDTNTK